MSSLLDRDFDTLALHLRRLIGLLEEGGDRYWIVYLQRGLTQVEERRLAGATYVLGCYGGADTFSDLVIGGRWETEEPLRYRNINARLATLRTETFDAANVIASRKHW